MSSNMHLGVMEQTWPCFSATEYEGINESEDESSKQTSKQAGIL